jgi:mevalonate pyrophosphate decarboxylase
MRAVTVTAHAAQGLTCFHQYRHPGLKTLSIDMLYSALEAFQTTTTLTCLEDEHADADPTLGGSDLSRAYEYLGRITTLPVQIETSNNFEADIGLASSASGYACLAAAASRLVGLSEDVRELSSLARTGSFSAAASVAGGISVVRSSDAGMPTFGEQIFHPDDLRDVSVVVAFARFHKANHDFYNEAASSPVVDQVRDVVADTANQMIAALETRDIDRLADLSERHSVLNYAVLHTGKSNLFLWQPETVAVMNFVRSLRKTDGEPIFYSMNTGANVFIYCFSDQARRKVESGLRELSIESRCSRVGGPFRYIDPTPADSAFIAQRTVESTPLR